MARQTGRLALWDDDRGFGFVEADDGQRLFVHVSSIRRIATRPRVGDRVNFEIGPGRDGRPSAVQVLIEGANPLDTARGRRAEPPRRRAELRDYVRVGGALLLTCLALAATVLDKVPLWVPGVYLGAGLCSALLYLVDKRAAEAGRWRISENLLLGLDLAGGIIGGLLAQQMLRHKTAKRSFVAASFATLALHLAALLGIDMGIVHLP